MRSKTAARTKRTESLSSLSQLKKNKEKLLNKLLELTYDADDLLDKARGLDDEFKNDLFFVDINYFQEMVRNLLHYGKLRGYSWLPRK